MKHVTPERIEHIAWLAHIYLNDEEKVIFTEQFNRILDFFRKIDEGTNCVTIGKMLEDARDNLPAGPVSHQLVQYSKELMAQGDKAIIGALRDEIEAKLKDFQNKYS